MKNRVAALLLFEFPIIGGTYDVAGTLAIQGAIVNHAATLILHGVSSSITYGGADALASTFSGNRAAGTFEILPGRNFTTAGAFSNEGTIDVGAGSILTVGGTFTNTGNLDINGTLSAQSIAIGAGQALSGWDRAIIPSATTWRGVSVLSVGQDGT